MRYKVDIMEYEQIVVIRKLLNSIIEESEDIEFFESEEIVDNMFLDDVIYNFKTGKLIFRIGLKIDKEGILIEILRRIINKYKDLRLHEPSNNPFGYIYIVGKTFISLKELMIKFNVKFKLIKDNKKLQIKTYRTLYRKEVVLETKYESNKAIIGIDWIYKCVDELEYGKYVSEKLDFSIKRTKKNKDFKSLTINIEREFRHNGYIIYLVKDFLEVEIRILLDKGKEIIKYIEIKENKENYKYPNLNLDITDYKLYDKLLNQFQNDTLTFLEKNKIYKLIKKYYQISNIIENILIFLVL